MDVVLIQILGFFSMLLLVLGLNNLRASGSAIQTSDAERPAMFRVFASSIDPIGRFLDPRLAGVSPGRAEKIRNWLLAAGLYERIAQHEIAGLQGFLSAGLAVVALLCVFAFTLRADWGLAAAMLMGLLGWVWPTAWLQRTAANRQEAIGRSLPYSMDLLSVAMQAGQDFGAALRFLVSEGPSGPLAQEFAVMLKQTELGKTRVEALHNLSDRIQLSEVKSLVTAVVQGAEMGASIAETLKIQAEEIRRVRFQKAERKAARAPSIMIIPVALFILPAVFIVIMTPIALKVFGMYHPMR